MSVTEKHKTSERALYEKRISRIEAQLEDLQAALTYHQTRGEETFPQVIVKRLIAGESALRVYREHRGLTQTALARKSGVRQNLISEIESGRKTGSVETLKVLAEALNLALDDLA